MPPEIRKEIEDQFRSEDPEIVSILPRNSPEPMAGPSHMNDERIEDYFPQDFDDILAPDEPFKPIAGPSYIPDYNEVRVL